MSAERTPLTFDKTLLDAKHKAGVDLIVKAVTEDPDYYWIDGIATTPRPDRVNDVVEPKGARVTLPIPLLWQHNHDEPVGEVVSYKAAADGITFRGRIPKIKEEGLLKQEIEKRVHQLKYGLVKGTSIGFKAVREKVEQMKDGGLHFFEWLWLELSFATIAMNEDARVTSIKSACGAATGHSVVRLNSPTPGASGTTTEVKGKDMKTIQERMSGWEAKRQAVDAARAAIMEKAEKDGDRTLEPTEKQEYSELTVQLDQIDEHLGMLRDEEKRVKATAKAVTQDEGEDPTKAAAARGRDVPHILSLKDQAEPGIDFARYVKAHLLARREHQDPAKLIQRMYPQSAKLHNIVRNEVETGQYFAKANVTAINTQDAAGGGAFVQFQDLLTEFLDWLRPQTILGKFGQGGVPALTRVDFLSRVRVQTSGGSGYWVGEGKPKPLTNFNFTNITMAITKVANIAVLTEEEVRFSTPAADSRVRNALAGALIERMDRDFIDPDFAGSANVSPASITYGAPTSAASGTINSAAIADQTTAVNSMLQYFPEATLSGLVWIMSGRTGYALGSAMNSLGQKQFPGVGIRGGEMGGIPVITSEYLAYGGGLSPASNNLAILVHAPSIFLADDGGVRIDSSTEASLQMLDNPTNDVMTPTATSLVSMFQTDSIALRAERMVNWKRARDNSVYVLTNVAYSGLAA